MYIQNDKVKIGTNIKSVEEHLHNNDKKAKS